jgi:hypothetical protein
MRASIKSNSVLNRFFAVGFPLLLLCVQISVSNANPLTLTPGGSIAASSESFPNGTLLDTTTASFSSASLSGTLISSVYNNDTDNEYGLAALTFTYEILLDKSSPDAASAISVGNFSGFATDVSYNPGNGGDDPTTISRDPDGSQIVFDFGGYILPGDDSAFLVVQTDGTVVNAGSASVVDDVGTPGIPSFDPTVVPDKTGLGSFMLSLGLLAGFGRLTRTVALKS